VSTSEQQELLDAVLRIARDAGSAILEIYDTEFSVEIKDDQSPLTAADLAAHSCIVSGLSRLEPRLPVLSEESSQIPFEERRHWPEYWLVDPLDGTREFIRRNGEFTVNIALIRNHQPVLGVVHVPVTGLDYYGAQGFGSYRCAHDEAPVSIQVSSGNGAARVVGSKSHRGSSLDAFLENLGDHQMLPMGSSLKFCLVAEGKADIYPRLGPTSEWDTAAAQAVLENAGGMVIGLDGKPLAYNQKECILNPFFLAIGDTTRDWLEYVQEVA
jgi:3'(2'), 5'-bisphosphate nucleotidase